MSNSAKHNLLNAIDNPARLLIFTYEQVGGFVGIFVFFTIVFNSPEFGIIFGVMAAIFLPILKKKLSAVSIKCLLYWFFPPNKSTCFILSFIREYIG